MKNEMIETIEKHGIDFTSEMISEYVNQKIASEDIAIQFILEELEAASQGNEMAKIFATTSGFDKDDYENAMSNSFEEVDGVDGPQQILLNLCMMLLPNQQLMTELRIKTVDNIMKEWQLGKYSAVNDKIRLIDVVEKNNDLDDDIFANINNDLNESITQDNNVMILMAYGYTRRTVAAGLYLQGVFNRENYMQASNMFKSLQLQTGQTVEFQEEAASQSMELLLSYSPRLTKAMINKITSVVELNQVECVYNNIYYNFDKVLDFFEENSKQKIIKDKYGNSYEEIVSPYTGRIWLDRNLGATQVPDSINDKKGFGDYFQWGRYNDGHEKRNSITTSKMISSKENESNNFILRPLSEKHSRYDWCNIKNDNLWQGINGENNPCPIGYRLPTLEEIAKETIICQGANNNSDAFDNFLKLPSTGSRAFNNGKIYYSGEKIFLWTSDTHKEFSVFLGFDDKEGYRRASGRAGGCSIRCIKD